MCAERAVLITRGVEPKDEAHVLALFSEHFGAGRLASALVNAVQNLYDHMGTSLRFQPPAPAAPTSEELAIGREALSVKQQGDRWRVAIRKA